MLALVVGSSRQHYQSDSGQLAHVSWQHTFVALKYFSPSQLGGCESENLPDQTLSTGKSIQRAP